MFQFKRTRERGDRKGVRPAVRTPAGNARDARMAVSSAALALFLLGGAPALAAPCCTVTDIEPNQPVTAREINGTRTLRFQVSDPALLRSLRVGSPVYANFDTGQVSLDGKKACCKIVGVGKAATQPPETTQAEPKHKPSGPPAKKEQTTLQVPKVEVTASEGSTATAMRGRPATPDGKATQTSTGATAAGAQTQALDPEILGLHTSADLVARNLAFTATGEITFDLVNRGKVGINVPVKGGSGLQLAAQAPASGSPITIDIWMGASKISVQQPSMGGEQTRSFTVPIPSTYPGPGCLETRDLKVAVDPQNQVAELHDDNNVTEANNSARPCPDLAIKSIKRHYQGLFNETYQPKVTVINNGNAPSPSTQVWGTSLPGGVWPVTGWPELVPTHTLPALDPGETKSFRVGGSVLSANHTAVRVILDRHFEIEESDESNNFRDEQL